jgi:hypothetical protein
LHFPPQVGIFGSRGGRSTTCVPISGNFFFCPFLFLKEMGTTVTRHSPDAPPPRWVALSFEKRNCQKFPMYGMPPFSYFEGGGKKFCRNRNPREESASRLPKFPAVQLQTSDNDSENWRGIKRTLQTAYSHSVDSGTREEELLSNMRLSQISKSPGTQQNQFETALDRSSAFS